MGTLRNGDRQWGSRNALKGFTEDALTISVRSFFQKGPPDCQKRTCDGGNNISVGRPYRHGREAVEELLHTGHAAALSRTSKRASAPFPMPS